MVNYLYIMDENFQSLVLYDIYVYVYYKVVVYLSFYLKCILIIKYI